MGVGRVPGPIGREVDDRQQADVLSGLNGSAATPGPLNPEPPEELGGGIPTVGDVTKNWDTSKKTTTPEIHGKGTTLSDLKTNLDASQGKHWGEGGGKLTMDPVTGVKAGETFTVKLNGEFIKRLPIWDDKASASAAAQKEWDRFIGKLDAHEEGHIAIALAAFEKLATDLIGVKITELNTKVQKAQTDLTAAQKKMDTDTDNGMKSGVPYGDAVLNTSIG
ncbi:MAG: DUF922 domain-containing protein [Acidobacteria bacterium]|nr:DUF922 domain-containing protein [Acidobacteriota bacterium]MCK6684425.1 DUF922 domain-containing Zn-dependent protease [Thermoanaerobaculia bacterium]